MYNGAAQLTAVNVAGDLVPVFNKVYGGAQIDDFSSIDKALEQIVTRAEQEFSSSGSLTVSRRQSLIDAAAELAVARTAAGAGDAVEMKNALKRAAGYLNALVVDVMTKMG